MSSMYLSTSLPVIRVRGLDLNNTLVIAPLPMYTVQYVDDGASYSTETALIPPKRPVFY
jgi:hypothetical protein